jgi:hypothetical protein
MGEARALTDRFFQDLEVIAKRRPGYKPKGTFAEEFMIDVVFVFLRRRLGQVVVRDLFGGLGPLPRSWVREAANHRLVSLYVKAGKPNRRAGKLSMAAFAREMAEWNKNHPWTERVGSGTTVAANMERQLKRLLGTKKYRATLDQHNGTVHK